VIEKCFIVIREVVEANVRQGSLAAKFFELPLPCNVKNVFKKFLYLHPDPDLLSHIIHLQNVIKIHRQLFEFSWTNLYRQIETYPPPALVEANIIDTCSNSIVPSIFTLYFLF